MKFVRKLLFVLLMCGLLLPVYAAKKSDKKQAKATSIECPNCGKKVKLDKKKDKKKKNNTGGSTPEPPSSGELDDVPKTGDDFPIGWAILFVVVSGALTIFAKIRWNKEEYSDIQF